MLTLTRDDTRRLLTLLLYGGGRKRLEALVWKHTHRDFRGKRDDGTRCVLHRDDGTYGTESWPLSSFTDAQLFSKLPARVRAELKATP